MGRPLNKRYFNSGAGDQIKIRARLAGVEGDGIILRQKGSKRFLVQVGANTGLCTLADKANGALVDGEMTITVANDAGTANLRVAKITAKKATLVNGTSAPWTFTNNPDPVMDMPEGADITIGTQPVDRSGIGAGATTFVVAATATAGETVSYQWQSSTDGGVTWNNAITANGYTNVTTATLGVTSGTGKIGNKYRCIVSSPTGGSVTSAVATLIS
jgi:hypothetical protein